MKRLLVGAITFLLLAPAECSRILRSVRAVLVAIDAAAATSQSPRALKRIDRHIEVLGTEVARRGKGMANSVRVAMSPCRR